LVLCWSQNDIHPQKYLAKFDYRPNMKESFKNPFIFWLPIGTCGKSFWQAKFIFQNVANYYYFSI
jgi:hypothetical protein